MANGLRGAGLRVGHHCNLVGRRDQGVAGLATAGRRRAWEVSGGASDENRFWDSTYDKNGLRTTMGRRGRGPRSDKALSFSASEEWSLDVVIC